MLSLEMAKKTFRSFWGHRDAFHNRVIVQQAPDIGASCVMNDQTGPLQGAQLPVDLTAPNNDRLLMEQVMNSKKKITTWNIGSLCLIVLLTTAIFHCTEGTIQAQTIDNNLNADISVYKKPLREVISQVEKQTKYRITLKSINDSILVSGQYQNTAVDKLFTQLLKGYNTSIEIDEKDKLITIVSLERKNNQTQGAQLSGQAPSKTVEIDSASPGKTVFSEPSLEEMRNHQADEIEQQQSDSDTVDQFTGLTLSELEGMHDKQILELNERIN